MKKPITLNYQIGNERDFLKKCIKNNSNVTIKRTNYSLKVETDRRNYYFSNAKSSGKRAFIAYNKIVKDIKASGLETPDLTSRDVKYWWFKDADKYPENFFSVDINSAYPTALLNTGAITQETYDWICTRIPKIDRLRCVGMLATQKGIYHYEHGVLKDFEADSSQYSGWFFMCCLIVGEIMDLCRKRYSDSVIHYWVDGIAMKENHEDCLAYIESLGYPSKIEVITDCRLVNNCMIYRKDGKKKYLHLPRKVNVSDEEARNFLYYGDLER